MRIVLTGSSGHVGRAIFSAVAEHHQIIGLDRLPCAGTAITADFADAGLLHRVMEGADAVIHTAALHAPHVAQSSEQEFQRINVEGTRLVAEAALSCGVGRMVFTSTTAVYGDAVTPGRCTWIDERATPQPKSIYHRTKLAAEELLIGLAGPRLAVRVLRMSRCFPEAAERMAAYRLHRGIDVRDVADAHVAALTNGGSVFQRHIISGRTQFLPGDCPSLATDPVSIILVRAPELVRAFAHRGWQLPETVDRVYASISSESELGWKPRFGFEEVLTQLDRHSVEVLPPSASIG